MVATLPAPRGRARSGAGRSPDGFDELGERRRRAWRGRRFDRSVPDEQQRIRAVVDGEHADTPLDAGGDEPPRLGLRHPDREVQAGLDAETLEPGSVRASAASIADRCSAQRRRSRLTPRSKPPLTRYSVNAAWTRFDGAPPSASRQASTSSISAGGTMAHPTLTAGESTFEVVPR